MLDLFAATVASLGPAPRRLAAPARTCPAWLHANQFLDRAEEARAHLLREGDVVPAWVVMANTLLFGAGTSSHPALVVYAPRGGVGVEALQNVTAALTDALRGAVVDSALAEVVGEMKKESASIHRPVPRSIAEGRELMLATVLVHRADLPRPYLASHLLPLVVHRRTQYVMVLPLSSWSPDLRAAWLHLAAMP
jgi:hypothetical protein